MAKALRARYLNVSFLMTSPKDSLTRANTEL